MRVVTPVLFCRVSRKAIAAGLLLATLGSLNAAAQVIWSQVPTPNPSTVRNLLRGISGSSPNDVWAVGHYQPTAASQKYENLLLHWTGAGWQTVTTANPGTAINDLFAVKVVSPNLAWAVGEYTDGGPAGAQLLKWNGSSWTQQAIQQVPGGSYLFGITAISATDAWAVGGKAGSPFPCYALHYNGSSWTEVAVPPAPGSGRNRFNAVHGLDANDVWAVGSWGVAVGDYHFLAMRWNGSAWVNVPIPSSVNNGIDGELADVKVVSSNDVWAVGYSLAGGAVTIHYDGTGWTEVTNPGGAGALAVLAPNNIYSVGGNITHWNGSAWTVSDTLMPYPWPALGAATVLPNSEIWAAGRTVDSANIFKTLVYRTGPNMPTSVTALSAASGIRAYPNPFAAMLRIALPEGSAGAVQCTLTDVAGMRIQQVELSPASGKGEIALPVSATLPAGVYLLEVKSGGEVQRFRLLRE